MDDRIAAIESLSRLRADGTLTEEEFNLEKVRLLSGQQVHVTHQNAKALVQNGEKGRYPDPDYTFQMSLPKAVERCLWDRYFSVKERASRSEFWLFTLFTLLMQLTGLIADQFVSKSLSIRTLPFVDGQVLQFGIFTALISVIFFIPTFTVNLRRMHDVNRSAITSVADSLLRLQALTGFSVGFLFTAFLWLFMPFNIFWAFSRGDFGTNGYGIDPVEEQSSGRWLDRPSKPVYLIFCCGLAVAIGAAMYLKPVERDALAPAAAATETARSEAMLANDSEELVDNSLSGKMDTAINSERPGEEIKTLLDKSIQGRWAEISESTSTNEVCGDPDGMGIWIIGNDRLDGYETHIKVLNVASEIGSELGRGWQAFLSIETEGELSQDTVEILLRPDGTLSIVGPNTSHPNLVRCGS